LQIHATICMCIAKKRKNEKGNFSKHVYLQYPDVIAQHNCQFYNLHVSRTFIKRTIVHHRESIQLGIYIYCIMTRIDTHSIRVLLCFCKCQVRAN